jgi:hypothetical protein
VRLPHHLDASDEAGGFAVSRLHVVVYVILLFEVHVKGFQVCVVKNQGVGKYLRSGMAIERWSKLTSSLYIRVGESERL